MAKRTYEFDIAAKIDGAVAAIGELASGAQSRLDKINFNTGVSAIRDGFLIIKDAAQFAFDAIEGFANKAIEESLEAEKAQNELANSLRLSGDFSEAAVRDFDDLAQSIASVSTFTADAVKSSVALSKQFRLTNAEARQAVSVAADLAAVQGITLEEATRKVSQTFNGFVDKSLAKVIPGLKNLSKEALIAGDAVDLIQQRVAGSAAALGDTFAGAAFRAGEAANDIFEVLGNLITQNPAIIAGINAITAALNALKVELEKNGSSLQQAITGAFVAIVQASPGVIKVIEFISERVNTLVGRFLQLQAVLKQPLTLFSDDPAKVKALTDELDAIGDRFGANQNALDDFFKPLIATTENLAKNIQKVADTAVKSGAKIRQNIAPSSSGAEARRQDAFSPDEIRKQVESAAKDPIKFTFEAIVKGQEINAKQGAAIAAGITANIVKGAEGAKKLIAAGIGAAADLVIPGIGGAVSEIAAVLAEGPEKTKQMVEEFARAIPVIIENLAESLPVLIETLARELPPALAKTMPTVAVGFSTALIQNIPNIVKGFAAGFVQAAKEAGQALIDAVKNIPGGIVSGVGSVAGDVGNFFGDVFGGVGDFLGFAEGGRVPDLPQFEGDRFPARLNAGEQVLDKDLSSDLENFLANGGQNSGPQVLNITLQVGRAQLANVLVELDRLNYRTTV